MRRIALRMIGMTLIAASGAACGSAVASPFPSPPAASYEQYAPAFCLAWDSMFRAIGNPDTGSDSELTTALDRAVEAGDLASADRIAMQILAELESGRQHVSVAAGWQPATSTMAQLDRVFLAFEAMIAAKRATAHHAPDAVDPQAAFESAGGAQAWQAMFETYRAIPRPSGATQCPTVPVSP